MTSAFPEIARYAMAELKRPRIVMGAVAVLILAAFSELVAQSPEFASDPGGVVYHAATIFEVMVLLFYGTVRVTGSIVAERAQGTWDLLRLTPQSSLQIAFGKLAGSAVFALYLFALAIPWLAAGALSSTKLLAGYVLWQQLTVVAASLLAMCAGLLASAVAVRAKAGTPPLIVGGGVAWLVSYSMIATLESRHGSPWTARYFGFELPWTAVVAGSCLAFAVWEFFAAKWAIGREFLERPRAWRIPAFLAFVCLHQLGFKGMPAPLALIAPAVFAYMIGLAVQERPDGIRRWLTRRGWALLDEAPAWLSAAASYAVLAIVVTAAGRPGDEIWQYPMLQACFLIRDLAFVQLCRFSRSRQPDLMAVVFLTLAYAVPAIAIGAFDLRHMHHLAAPVPDAIGGLGASVAPALLQAALLAALVGVRAARLVARRPAAA